MDIKKRIALVLLSLNIFLTSCGIQKDNKISKDYTTNETKPNKVIEIIASKYDGLTLSNEDKDFLNSTINMPSMQNFINYVKTIDVTYPYEELYSNKHIDYEVSKVSEYYLDINVLYKKVIENNKAYQDLFNNDTYNNTTDEFVYDVCKKIIRIYNKLIARGINLDKEHINSNLSTLKIFLYKGYNYGYYNPNQGILGINITNDKDTLDDVLNHEIMHIFTGSNKKELDNIGLKNKVGYLYSFGNEEINPFNWTWFSEASAESLGRSINEKGTLYEREIKSLEFMKFATFNTSYDIECTLFSSDINTLYACFPNLTHDEVNKMFYAYTIIFNSNTAEEGYNFYRNLEKKGITIKPGEYDNFESTLKSSIALSLSKEFYINMAQRIESKSVNLNDIFKLISAFELELSRELWYQSKYEDLEYFLSNYYRLQKMFFDVISINLKVDTDYLKELYYMYNNEITINDINISFLSDTENSFINYINESRIGNKKDAILKVYDDNFTSNLSR